MSVPLDSVPAGHHERRDFRRTTCRPATRRQQDRPRCWRQGPARQKMPRRSRREWSLLAHGYSRETLPAWVNPRSYAAMRSYRAPSFRETGFSICASVRKVLRRVSRARGSRDRTVPTDDALAVDRQAVAASQGQRHDPEIDVGGQPAIEAHLCFGIASPGLGSREIKAVAAQGLLELVDVPIGQKYPREVRLDNFDPGRLLRIDPWCCEERHLAADINVLRCRSAPLRRAGFRRAHSPITLAYRRSPPGGRAPPPVRATTRRFRPGRYKVRAARAARAAAPVDLLRGCGRQPGPDYRRGTGRRALPGRATLPLPAGLWRATRGRAPACRPRRSVAKPACGRARSPCLPSACAGPYRHILAAYRRSRVPGRPTRWSGSYRPRRSRSGRRLATGPAVRPRQARRSRRS